MNKGEDGGVNPSGKGPAQPKDVGDPHPQSEEGYDRAGERTSNAGGGPAVPRKPKGSRPTGR
jgi:hypothetical protein